jgi:hypothetical protein
MPTSVQNCGKQLAYPILTAFEKWIVSYYPKTLPKGRMNRALSYTYSLFHRLSRYHLDGRYQIDNNLVENAIRPLALGRKNFLFCGNHDAAENAAIMYSLIGCCNVRFSLPSFTRFRHRTARVARYSVPLRCTPFRATLAFSFPLLPTPTRRLSGVRQSLRFVPQNIYARVK